VSSGACGCTAPGAADNTGAWALFAAAMGLVLRSRRKQRS
jgi:MYXO-CTERM domain-containing protein